MRVFLTIILMGSVLGAVSYEELSDKLAAFRSNVNAQRYKHRYVELIQGFQEFVKKSPKSDRAGDSLMYAARLLEDMAHVTNKPADFRIAEKAYLTIVSQYPNDDLVDAALYRAQRIRAAELHDKAGAIRKLNQILIVKDNEKRLVASKILLGQLGAQLARPHTAVALAPKKAESKATKSYVELRPKKIVLDPGHGGYDPGAIGRGGLREKDVTLAVAKKIKKMIEYEMPDIRVYMTRNDDQFVSLPKRTEFANQLEADLFISIHVNSAPNKHATGVETYYLDITHDRYGMRLAARENAMSENEISNLEYILADLAMKSNVNDSIRLGQIVQSSTFLRIQQDWDDSKDLGLKHALFAVLLGARMPAILVETSFISNHNEEKRLKTDPYKHALAEGVVKGIKRYIEEKQAMYVP